MKFLAKLIIKAYIAVFLAVALLAFPSTKDPSKLEPVDLIIVHGAGGEDNMLMAPSIDRAHKAAEAYHAGLAPKIIVTGGRDKVGNKSVAEMMGQILLANGVPQSAIFLEGESRSTIQNLQFSAKLVGGFPKRIALVSTGFHLPRCWLSAKALGANEVVLLSANRFYHPTIPNGIYILAREALAWPVNFLRIMMHMMGINSDWVFV